MAEAKPIASLTPTLLARKGGARPAIRKAAPAPKTQALRRQREELADRLAGAAKPRAAIRAVPATARLSAFTLRLDAERRLKLRLASVVANRSAQQLLVEALDSMLTAMPEVAELASRTGKQR